MLAGERAGARVVEHGAARGEEDAPRPIGPSDVLDRRHQGLRHHHHALAAAVGRVVDLQMTPAGIVAQLVEGDLDHAACPRPGEHAGGERRAEDLRKERQNVDPHAWPAPTSAELRAAPPASRRSCRSAPRLDDRV